MRGAIGGALVVLLGCGAAAGAPEVATSGGAAPAPGGDAPVAAEAPGPAAAEAKGPAAADAPAAQESESQALARDLLKSGGRRIGWSASKKGFIVPSRKRTGQSLSLDLLFVDDAGQTRETMHICSAGECDEHMAERVTEATPKLVSRLDGDHYVAIRAIGWPAGRDELDVSSLGMKLRSSGGRLEGVREGKPALRIGAVRPAAIIAIFVVPEAKRLGVISGATAEAQEPDQSFSVLNLP